MRTIAIINQKGGCGKTTTAINLGGILAASGYRTLLVDMDPQAHCAAGLAVPEDRVDLDVVDLLLADPAREIDAARLVWHISRNLDLIPSRMRLAGLEAPRGGLAEQPDKERRLAASLARFGESYDVCLIDCSPAIGLLAYNALTAASAILIPVETGFFSLEGATKQANTVRTLSRRFGVEAPCWLVATIHDESLSLSADLLGELQRRFGDRVAPTVIRRDPKLKEAASFGQPVIEYAPTSQGARDYTALAEWLEAVVGLGGDMRPRMPVPIAAEPTEVYSPPDDLDPAPNGAAVVGELEAKPGAGAGVHAPAAAEPAVLSSRAEELAAKARQLLLRRAEDQLGRIADTHARPKPTGTAPSVLRVEAPAARPAAVPEPARQEAVRPLFGARATGQGVLFVQPVTLGERVAIAGDFNAWSPTTHVMRRNDELGVFELCIPLPPGRYRYRVVVDGRWSPDPFNGDTERNEFGEPNSVISAIA